MIGPFKGKYSYLSNFYSAVIHYGGLRYPSVEHAYQASKSLDIVIRRRISVESSPVRARYLGRLLARRADWEQIKLTVMTELVFMKFSDYDLRLKLLKTSSHELVEINVWGDVFWGVCNGVGDNHLGKILMSVRERLEADQ